MAAATPPAVVVAGESLVDLVPAHGMMRPVPGGSPHNVAVGLARLGVPTAFMSRLSTDGFGRMLERRLGDEGADTSLSSSTDDPTTLAVVHLDPAGDASYGFYLQGTSASGPLPATLGDRAGSAALHVSLGAITLAHDPAGAALSALLRAESGRRVRSLDPNVRPAVIDDLATYARLVDGIAGEVEIVKASADDLALLHPDRDPGEVAAGWSTGGPGASGPLVVVTRGAHGAVAYLDGSEVAVEGLEVTVADTVGAGDAFTAGLLAALHEQGRIDPAERLRAIDEEQLRAVVAFAVRVSAVACTRTGADPPRRDEL